MRQKSANHRLTHGPGTNEGYRHIFQYRGPFHGALLSRCTETSYITCPSRTDELRYAAPAVLRFIAINSMDPLTHTLAGASLAQTRLGRVALGTTTCIIGANLPDLDAITYFLNGNISLGFRRGWTHGVLAMSAFPPLLAVAMSQIVRLQRRPAASFGRLLALSTLAVWSHPALDWLNTYGVRLLMPFDGRWFYGDVLFIVDPWLWLLLGTACVVAHSKSWPQLSMWLTLGAVSTILVTSRTDVPDTVRILWFLGLAIVAAVRNWSGPRTQTHRVAVVCLSLALMYITTMIGSAMLARAQVDAWARAQGISPRQIMVAPRPGNPFRRQVILADDRHYHPLAFDWLSRERIFPVGPQTDIGADHPAAAAALTAPEVWGLATWARFPSFAIEPRPPADGGGYRVTIADMRFGGVTVDMDADLEPSGVHNRFR